MASIPALRRAALRASWAPEALFSSGIIAGDKPILVRDYVRSALYDPNHGYFSKRSGPVGVLDSSIRFHQLEGTLGRSAYLQYLDKLYKKHDIAWFTPVELFKIYEIGGGSGTCAKCILDYMMLNAPPKVYNKYEIHKLLDTLHQALPSMFLIASDCSLLPDKDGKTLDHRNYLDAQDDADIFFPTDFWLLKQIDHYCSGFSKEQKNTGAFKPVKKRTIILDTAAFKEEFLLPLKRRQKMDIINFLMISWNTKFYLSFPTHK